MPGILGAGAEESSAHMDMSSRVTFVLRNGEQPWSMYFLACGFISIVFIGLNEGPVDF